MDLKEKIEKYFKRVLSKELKRSIDSLKSDISFDKMGIDSLMIIRLNKILDRELGKLPRTLFYEYNNIHELSNYMLDNYSHLFTKNPQIEIAGSCSTPIAENSVFNNKEVLSNQIEIQLKVESLLKQIISTEIKKPLDQIKSDTSFEELGLDSFLIIRINKKLDKKFGELPKTLFYEFKNIKKLAEYFIINHLDKIKEHLLQAEESDFEFNSERFAKQTSKSKLNYKQIGNILDFSERINNLDDSITTSHIGKNAALDIAIIGIDGIYPQANNLTEFWGNLVNGKDCITEIPRDRWDYTQVPFKSRSIWGGFISDIDKFDPLFFNISPREAELMDPQQRIFLEVCWKAIEDSGYSLELFKAKNDQNVGVFVGSSWTEYEIIANNSSNDCPDVHIGSIATRISYHLGFQGPSLAIDTHCSSSLTSIYLACQSIHNGDCNAAIAGGVNLSLHFNKYKQMNSFLSNEGKCRSFGDGGNGYVPSEGVGAIVLKPLDEAINDGDHIYGVIKSGAINHGGKTNGYTVPNPNAQSSIIKLALSRAGIDARSISCIEAHGTGTELGDPIEFAGLTKAFESSFGDKQFCSLGSVKSNIGHSEAAAGIAQITKVLLQMKYKMFVPSIHSKNRNKNISFENTPFYLQEQLSEWRRPEVFENGQTIVFPRRAGISSFGAGGANAHLIIEEYENKQMNMLEENKVHLIPLSAKNKNCLNRYILNFIDWLRDCDTNSISLASIAYTLQIGREAMEERIIVVVSNINDLIEQLANFIEGTNSKVLFGKKESNNTINNLISLDEDNVLLSKLIEKERFEEIAKLWVIGANIDWNLLYGKVPTRISLPTYPFERMRCWLHDNNEITHNSEYKSLFLKKTWKESELKVSENKIDLSCLIIFANPDTYGLAKQINEILTSNKGIIIIDKTTSNDNEISGMGFAFQDAKQGLDIATQLLDKVNAISSIIDLSDIYNTSFNKSRTSIAGRISFLQQVIKRSNSNNLFVFHLTINLQAFMTMEPTLGGADYCGFIKMIGYEYQKVTSKTVDIDIPLKSESEILKLIIEEFKYCNNEICYRKGIRYIPYFKQLKKPCNINGNGLTINPEQVYVITGGTSGIGAEIANYLAQKGARKLVLMGINAFPDKKEWDRVLNQKIDKGNICKKISNIIELENKGVSIELYIGTLTNKNRLDNFFEAIRTKYGSIGGVVHCAGVLSKKNLMFINKEPEEVSNTFAPKVQGLEVLHDIFQKDHLDFFILFSSISSVIPWLATGGSDYAAANDFMNYYADYQFCQGNTYYKSIVWPSWKGVGMGEVTSHIYIDMGFKSHTLNEGLQLFDKIFDFRDESLIVPCYVNTEVFDTEKVLYCKDWSRPKFDTKSRIDFKPTADIENTINWLKQFFSDGLKIPIEQLNDDVSFDEYGVDSIRVAELVQKMEETFHIQLNPSIILEYPTLKSLANYMLEENIIPQSSDNDNFSNVNPLKKVECKSSNILEKTLIPSNNQTLQGKIAVIGMACNFPNSPNLEMFWHNLANGVDCIREVPKSRFDIESFYYPEYKTNCSISKYGGFIDNIEDFDPKYFKINEEDAPQIDPLIRQFMETSIQAIKNAGYEEHEFSGKKIGVYAGARMSNFANRIKHMSKNTAMGIGQNFIASHISHFLNLKGPSMVIDTACSSSLTSVHIACQSLLLGEIDMALAGGVDILIDEKAFILLSEAKALSPDGKCFTFDERANGFVPGEGCGVVILKPLRNALDDGDNIMAVIDGSAINNDGHTMGITTPNPEAQKEVIEAALKRAGVSPSSISYIEAHGTGTLIGDPIELKALTQVFRKHTQEKQFCSIGSVKTNHGHLLSASGISGFIKVILSMVNKQIPPSLNCKHPNSRFDFENSPFYINSQLQPWETRDGIRRAGISSLGFGGTNAHIIISECPDILFSKKPIIRKPLSPISFDKKRYWIDNNSDFINIKKGEQNPPRILEIVFDESSL